MFQNGDRELARSRLARRNQVFAIAIAARDGAFHMAQRLPMLRMNQPLRYLHHRVRLPIVVSHNPALADVRFAYLELRFDERDQPSATLDNRECRRESQFERDKADIDNRRLRFPPDKMLVHELTRVQPLERNDSCIICNFWMKLVMSDINGVDFGRTTLEQHFRESTCGSADVETDKSLRRDRKPVERRRELECAARDIGMRGRVIHARVGGQQLCRLFNPYAVCADVPRRNRSLRFAS